MPPLWQRHWWLYRYIPHGLCPPHTWFVTIFHHFGHQIYPLEVMDYQLKIEFNQLEQCILRVYCMLCSLYKNIFSYSFLCCKLVRVNRYFITGLYCRFALFGFNPSFLSEIPLPSKDHCCGFQLSSFHPAIAICYTDLPFDYCLGLISSVTLFLSFF